MFHAINHANIHDVIALLNDNEVDVNCTNINGQTPLHVGLNSLAFWILNPKKQLWISDDFEFQC